MMRVNCRLIRRETSKNGRYWTHRWASLQTSRSSFLGRFWVGTSWIKDHLFWFWVPKDWSNIILSWRTSFRNVHSGMSTALHRANWVQQNLTSRKCSSTPLYILMHHWLSLSRSCVMIKMTPGIDWTMSLGCARIHPRCQEKRSLQAGILLVWYWYWYSPSQFHQPKKSLLAGILELLLVWYCYCPLGLESVSPTNSWRLGNLGYCPCSSYCPSQFHQPTCCYFSSIL